MTEKRMEKENQLRFPPLTRAICWFLDFPSKPFLSLAISVPLFAVMHLGLRSPWLFPNCLVDAFIGSPSLNKQHPLLQSSRLRSVLTRALDKTLGTNYYKNQINSVSKLASLPYFDNEINTSFEAEIFSYQYNLCVLSLKRNCFQFLLSQDHPKSGARAVTKIPTTLYPDEQECLQAKKSSEIPTGL